MSNTITTISVKEDFFGKIISTATPIKKDVRNVGRGLTKYSTMSEQVLNQDFYVTNPRKAANVKEMNVLQVDHIKVVPSFYQIDNNWIPSYVFLADSVSDAGAFDPKDFKPSEAQIPKIKANGDITDFTDFEGTFGTLEFLGATLEYFRNPVTNQLTGDIDSITAMVRSSKLGVVYEMSIMNENSVVRSLPMGTILKFVEPTARVFRNAGEVENRAVSISFKVQDLIETTEDKKAPVKATQASQSSKPKANDEK